MLTTIGKDGTELKTSDGAVTDRRHDKMGNINESNNGKTTALLPGTMERDPRNVGNGRPRG